MVRMKPAQPLSLLGWMDSLSDTTRLRLLRMLERHELGVADLFDVVQMPQSTVSRHLKVLLDQKWIRSRREGTNHLYRMILDELDPAARRLWLGAAGARADGRMVGTSPGRASPRTTIEPARRRQPGLLRRSRGRMGPPAV